MTSKDKPFFVSQDLKIAKRINPFLLGVGGHSVVPHGDLMNSAENLAFITQVRDPVARTISQYRFRINRLKRKNDHRAFLQHPVARNFQVRKIAGCEDLDLAKENLTKNFLLAGSVNQFDAFLVLLAQKLRLPLDLFTYSKQNIGANRQHVDIPPNFRDRLREQNQLDLKLVEWIDDELFPSYIAAYPGNFETDLKRFTDLQHSHTNASAASALDFIYRNAYMKPVSGVIRLSNGLPYLGSYSTG